MRKIREVLRLALAMKLSGRAIARSCGSSPSTISDYLHRAEVAQIAWPLAPELDDDEVLERLLFRDHAPAIERRPEPDWGWVHAELRRHKHATKQLLWQEYRGGTPTGLGYSQFCERYLEWARGLSVTMRQTHKAGEKVFVDFSGDGIMVYDAEAGQLRKVTLFIAVLGASNLTFVEPVWSEDLPTWLGCHARAFDFFGGVPEIVVPDNPRVGVTRPDRYDPDLNRSYADLADHYGVAVIPARVRRPRDKAKVEQGVLLAERWILAALRNHHFGSLSALQEAIAPLAEKLNNRKMRRLGKSRRAMFEELERGELRPLPLTAYVMASWSKWTIGPDYHVVVDDHYYSVPFTLVTAEVDIRATETTVEVFHNHKRVASHVRSRVRGGKTTLPEHMPRAHREYADCTPARIRAWAETVGPSAVELIEKIFEAPRHPQQTLLSALGVMRLGTDYPAARMERACKRALTARTHSRKSVLGILRHRLDEVEDVVTPAPPPLPVHENLRGPSYYA